MFYDFRNSLALQTLLPTVRSKANEWLIRCNAVGNHFLITQGYRNWIQQAWDYASGRTRPGSIITFAKPGYSFHGYRVAFDFVPADDSGLLHYDDLFRYNQAIDIAISLGFEAGRDFPRFKDTPHLQYTEGHDISFFRNGGVI